jgi:type II secretory pathway component PulF
MRGLAMAIDLARVDNEAQAVSPEAEAKEQDARVGAAGRLGLLARVSILRSKKVSIDELVLFTQRLTLLLRTGNSLVPSIAALSTQAGSPVLKEVLEQVHADLQGGSSLSESLRRHPNAFNSLYVNIVRAGEATGALLESLEQLEGMLDIERGLRTRIREAVTYPAVLVFIMAVVLAFTMTYVLPRFAGLFAGMEDELPITTRFLIGFTALVHSRWWILVPITLLAALGARMALASGALRRAWDRVKLRIPMVGRLYEEAYLYRLFTSFSLLLTSHVPLLEAVEIVRGLVQDARYGVLFDSLSKRVETGHGVTRAFQDADFLPDTVKLMVATGETSGALDTVMGTLAGRYREDLESDIRRFSAMLEPALLIVMGVFVGLIAISLIVPIFRMSRTIH